MTGIHHARGATVGVPREIKPGEARAGLTPAGAKRLVAQGRRVLVERGLGSAIGFPDSDYEAAGAQVAASAAELFAQADLIVKVKEPQPAELGLLRPGQLLFTYLHLAADPAQAAGLVRCGAIAIAYETVTAPRGGLPLLAPMSEIAGRLAVQEGAWLLELPHGGSGVLLGGAAGAEPAHVVVLGAGTAGANAVDVAVGMGARVTVLNRGMGRLRALGRLHGHRIATRLATAEAVADCVQQADLVIGAVLVPGAAAPRLVDRATVARMRPGSAIVDISIDQGGCFETSRPTTHGAPAYVEHGVQHFCVTNMPAAVARTATQSLTCATLPFVEALARDWRSALAHDEHLRAGLNVYRGEITCKPVAQALGLAWRDPQTLFH